MKLLAPLLFIVAFPALAPVSKNAKLLIPLLLIVAFPALAPVSNNVKLAPLLLIVAFPAVAPAVNDVELLAPKVLIVCTFVELFTIPTPWRIRLPGTGALVPCAIPTWIVKALALELKVMDLTVLVAAEIVGDVFVEVLKVAVSGKLTGAFVGDQFTLVFQLEFTFPNQVASTASAELGPTVNNSGTNDALMTENRINTATNSPKAVARKRRNLLASLVVRFLAIMAFAILGVCGFRKAFPECERIIGWDKVNLRSSNGNQLRNAQCSEVGSNGANQN